MTASVKPLKFELRDGCSLAVTRSDRPNPLPEVNHIGGGVDAALRPAAFFNRQHVRAPAFGLFSIGNVGLATGARVAGEGSMSRDTARRPFIASFIEALQQPLRSLSKAFNSVVIRAQRVQRRSLPFVCVRVRVQGNRPFQWFNQTTEGVGNARICVGEIQNVRR